MEDLNWSLNLDNLILLFIIMSKLNLIATVLMKTFSHSFKALIIIKINITFVLYKTEFWDFSREVITTPQQS